MMIPMNTLHYQASYVRHDDRSEVEKCLESPEFADILQKDLKEEQLNDDDVNRITSCIEERRETDAKCLGFALGILALIVIVVVIISIFA